MDKPTEPIGPTQSLSVQMGDRNWLGGGDDRRALTEGPMRPMSVVVSEVVGENPLKLAAVEDEYPVEAFPTRGPDEPFRERVRPRRPHGGAQDPDAHSPKIVSKL